ncbi:MAG: nucleoside-triphosphatase [Methanocorpusculum sp.]|nr:nucleoside-triphosphatase [Methanocorpusculum sp.]
MARHIFLTGDLQVGKSTIISKVLAETELSLGGFKTVGSNYKENGESDIIIYPADKSPDEGYTAAHRKIRGKEVFPEIFDTRGTEFLSKPAELIIMDELGFMESDAKIFQSKVLETLNCDISVLGVVRNMRTPFLDKVRENKNVDVIFVTKENREDIFKDVLKKIRALEQ